MDHSFFFDGNSRRIVWIIQTDNSTVEQKREHPDIYRNKVSTHQSKYIAMHVGLFWGIGRLIINNEDSVAIKIDDKTMFGQFSRNEIPSDELIKTRIHFITQLMNQRKLKINYELVGKEENLASKIL